MILTLARETMELLFRLSGHIGVVLYGKSVNVG
jgi:hypothetical protein